MLTGMPLLTPQQYSTATVQWAEKTRGVKVERGALIPWEDFWRHARSLGDDEAPAHAFYDANEVVRITKGKNSCFVGAGHFQFAAPKAVLDAVLPIPAERPMGRVRLLDELVNQAGYLRLSLPEWYVEHLGNTLPDDSFAPLAPAPRPRRLWLPYRKLLQWLYDRIFNVLHRG
jgi:hypothetical protein